MNNSDKRSSFLNVLHCSAINSRQSFTQNCLWLSNFHFRKVNMYIYILAIFIVIDPTFCGDNPLFSLIRIYIFLEVSSCVNDSKQLRGDESNMYTHLPKHLEGNIFPVTRRRRRPWKKDPYFKNVRLQTHGATIVQLWYHTCKCFKESHILKKKSVFRNKVSYHIIKISVAQSDFVFLNIHLIYRHYPHSLWGQPCFYDIFVYTQKIYINNLVNREDS